MLKNCIAAISCFLLLAPGCTTPPPDPLEDLPPLTGFEADPEKMPAMPEHIPERVCAAHLLVSYRGAKDAYKKVELNRAQARVRAEHLLVMARAAGTDFKELVERYSNDSKTSRQGGSLGVSGRGKLHPALEKAAFSMGKGQVSEIVETPRGFHILMRIEPTEAQAAEIVVSYDGAKRYTPRQPRSRAEAEQLANEIRKMLEGGKGFEQLAIEYSDLPNHERGGVHRIFRKDTRHPDFEKIVWNLKVDEVSDIIETPTGFHIVKRLPVRRVEIRSIVIGYLRKKTEVASENLPSRTEAMELARRIHDGLVNDDADFAAMASRHSTGAGSNKGGLMGEFGKGQQPYEADKTAFSLDVGEISDVFEYGSSFFILKRIR